MTHERAVAELVAAYRALPADQPVRLAKRTSNLFRFGQRAPAAALDVSGLAGVLSVDPDARTADVQGMTTYEDLVAATLPHGLMPYVVPQLRTITLGGAVSGLGIESTSFRSGLPHESVTELDILTGAGQVVTARPGGPHADLFDGFPNSYGTLGYALRLTIKLEPVQPYVRLRHVRFDSAAAAMRALPELSEGVDFVDGTVFSPAELYLTLGTKVAEPDGPVSDYTGQRIFYRSIQAQQTDHLTIHDYLWRWDTDWFWCSAALGVQHPVVRRLWPGRWRRSDVYRRLVAMDRRYGVSDRLDRWRGRPDREAVIQDVEVPVDRTAEFLDFFHREVGITPVWLCPLRATRTWPLYPLKPGELYVNVGFWSSVPLRGGESDGHYNRLIEETVTGLGGHKSLYSTSYYTEEEFWRLYNGATYQRLKDTYDPKGRLLDLYDKCVRSR